MSRLSAGQLWSIGESVQACVTELQADDQMALIRSRLAAVAADLEVLAGRREIAEERARSEGNAA